MGYNWRLLKSKVEALKLLTQAQNLYELVIIILTDK